MKNQLLKNKLDSATNDFERAIALINLVLRDIKSFDLSIKSKNVQSDFKKVVSEIKQKLK